LQKTTKKSSANKGANRILVALLLFHFKEALMVTMVQ